MAVVRFIGNLQPRGLIPIKHGIPHALNLPKQTFSCSNILTQMIDPKPKDRNVNKRLRSDARDIFNHAVEAVLPGAMVKRNLKVCGDKLLVGCGKNTRTYSLSKNVHIVAFGKAVAGMVRASEEVLGEHITGGIASIPTNYTKTFESVGRKDLLPLPGSKVQMFEGAANNLPDHEAHRTSLRIMQLAQGLTERDIMLTLISGGGSSLLTAPKPPITIDELRTFSKVLSTNGATITEMNTVRKQLEILKGGGLSRVASPAQVISLILSDVIGDPLDFIASGPTYPDYSTPHQCLDLFKKLGVSDQVPQSVLQVLELSQQEHAIKDPRPTTLAGRQALLANSHNLVVGSNTLATESAAQKAKQAGYLPFVLSNTVNNEACVVGTQYSRIARFICRSMGHKVGKDSTKLMQDEVELVKMGIPKAKVNELRTIAEMSVNTGKAVCVICGGETVVQVRGKGNGGRNQEMALACAINMHERIYSNEELLNNYTILFFTAGSDGMDGPCDAAGALVTPETITKATIQGLDAGQYLANNDSYEFFKQLDHGRNHVITGHTGTNVMDIQLLVIQPLLV